MPHSTIRRMEPLALTACALVAFAANSVLCRLALGGNAIDAASFSTVRLVSGALALVILLAVFQPQTAQPPRRNWVSAFFLFLYAVPFSFAYLKLGAGTGALILFGSVQTTMISAALRSGERPHVLEWAGLLSAVTGLVYLVFPNLAAPPPAYSALMVTAGTAWGFYSLRGRGAKSPLADTAGNFRLAVPFAVLVNAAAFRTLHVTPAGVWYALLSGVLASGVGYVVWYSALKHLTATRAATVQLAVPVLAAAGGIVFLCERISMRLVVAAVMILGGVGLALIGTKMVEIRGFGVWGRGRK